jgi:hypothetical protein
MSMLIISKNLKPLSIALRLYDIKNFIYQSRIKRGEKGNTFYQREKIKGLILDGK